MTDQTENLSREEAREMMEVVHSLARVAYYLTLAVDNFGMVNPRTTDELAARAWKMLAQLSQPQSHGKQPE